LESVPIRGTVAHNDQELFPQRAQESARTWRLHKVHAAHRTRIGAILSDLDVADNVFDLDLPKYQLHPLKGALAGCWSVRVSGNWRITFRFERGDVYKEVTSTT